jgi:ATP-dependent helicase/nuclease subunit A
VKRETDQAAREVRIMTVHGAKGLEADIVILADTCSNKGAAAAPVFFLDDGSGAPEIPVWAVKGTGSLQPVADVKDAIKASEQREMGRLLYVAMTRARDRLYVAGFHNGSLPESCWYATIQNALGPALAEAQDFQGRPVWRTGLAEALPVLARLAPKAEDAGLPAWIAARPAIEPRGQSLPASKLIQAHGSGDAASGAPGGTDRKLAQSRGTLIHRLLEVLPALSEEHWPLAARLTAQAFSSELSAQLREAACKDALALLSGPALRPFDRGSVSEAGLAVAVCDATGNQIASILGQADRLVFADGQVTVIDYKSGTLAAGAAIHPSHLAQLACYRLALQRIYPEATIRAALFNTRLGASTEAASEALETALADVLKAALTAG